MQEKKYDENTKVAGSLMQGYAQACLNLNIIAGSRVQELIQSVTVSGWYPLENWVALEKAVIRSYKNANAILVRVGMEMMLSWYNYGPGKQFVKKGVDFLHYQTGSEGYESVVQGSKEAVGVFKLVSLDEKEGKAVVYSTTPFNKKMECGVLIGGMMAPGDLDFVDVTNYDDPNYIQIEFH